MDLADIQRRLAGLGLDPGPVDGKIGPRTLAAMGEALDGYKQIAKPVITPASSAIAAIVTAHPKAARSINEIIIHCTATPEGKDYSVDTIRSWHRARGWSDIGYHWLVGLDGTVRQGRPEAKIGSHVAGRNTGTLGVVYVGGVAKDGKTPKDTRTPAQKAALIDLVKALIAKYPTVKKVTGHNQYANKACPSFNVRADPLGKLV